VTREDFERLTLIPISEEFSVLYKGEYSPKYFVDFERDVLETMEHQTGVASYHVTSFETSTININTIQWQKRTYRDSVLRSAAEVIAITEKTGYIVYPSQIHVETIRGGYYYSLFTRVPNEKEKIRIKMGELFT